MSSPADNAPPEPGGPPAPVDAGDPERRYTGPDRRRRPTPRFSRYSLWGGRRRDVRRGVELDGSFVDQYDLGVVLVLFWTGLMNAADSFFTLWHLQSGGIELNPVAAWMLEGGRLGFVVLKSGLIALPLVVLVVHKNFALARIGLGFAAAAYTVLFAYHISLL